MGRRLPLASPRRRTDPPRASALLATVIGRPPIAASSGGREAERLARGGNPEAVEQAETPRSARRARRGPRGRRPRRDRPDHSAGRPDGWAGERRARPRTDDWEPAIAADPNAPVRVPRCSRATAAKPCRQLPVAVTSSWALRRQRAARGAGASPALCACKGSWQYDPIIEVVPDTGDVYAAVDERLQRLLLKSTDHGMTWSDPVTTYGNVSLERQAGARDERRRAGTSTSRGTARPAATRTSMQSHDFGATWTQTKLVDSKRYFFAFDADVLPDGTVVFSESSMTYTGPGGAPEGVVQHHAFIVARPRRDVGEPAGRHACRSASRAWPTGCSPDFYLGHSARDRRRDGRAHVPLRRRDRLGRAAADLGPPVHRRRPAPGAHGPRCRRRARTATTPPSRPTGNGDVRAWYMQTNGDADAWNVWYRTSGDGGLTWSAPVKISDATSGAAYKNAAGSSRSTATTARSRSPARGKDDRDLGRGLQLDRARRRLGEPADVSAELLVDVADDEEDRAEDRDQVGNQRARQHRGDHAHVARTTRSASSAGRAASSRRPPRSSPSGRAGSRCGRRSRPRASSFFGSFAARNSPGGSLSRHCSMMLQLLLHALDQHPQAVVGVAAHADGDLELDLAVLLVRARPCAGPSPRRSPAAPDPSSRTRSPSPAGARRRRASARR